MGVIRSANLIFFQFFAGESKTTGRTTKIRYAAIDVKSMILFH
jgi:hypothetical protein